MPAEIVLFTAQSLYQKIELTELTDGEIALYLDDAIQFVSGEDEENYHRALASVPAQMLKQANAHALILGGGDGLAARNLVKLPNIESVTLVEIDPEVVLLSSTYPAMKELNENVFDDQRLKVFVEDARAFIKAPPQRRFSIAILDFVDPGDPEFDDLFSEEFFSGVMRHLEPGREILAVQASTAYSDAEYMVRRNLAQATKTRPIALRYDGEWMLPGSIVLAGHGVDRNKIPVEYLS